MSSARSEVAEERCIWCQRPLRWDCDEIVVGRLACDEHQDEVVYYYLAPVGCGG